MEIYSIGNVSLQGILKDSNNNVLTNIDLDSTSNFKLKYYLGSERTSAKSYKLEVKHTGTSIGSYNLYVNNIIDDITALNPMEINSAPFSYTSMIDYDGDVDYYTFTNMDGIYDIYSISNIDLKAKLYICDTASCDSLTLITENDNWGNVSTSSFKYENQPIYIEKLTNSNYNMGDNDFGFNINLGYDWYTYKKTFLLIIESSSNQEGSYTLNINNGIDNSSYEVEELRNQGIIAVFWESNFIPSVEPRTSTPLIYRELYGSEEYCNPDSDGLLCAFYATGSLNKKLIILDIANFMNSDIDSADTSKFSGEYDKIKEEFVAAIDKAINNLENIVQYNTVITKVEYYSGSFAISLLTGGTSTIVNFVVSVAAGELLLPNIIEYQNQSLNACIDELDSLKTMVINNTYEDGGGQYRIAIENRVNFEWLVPGNVACLFNIYPTNNGLYLYKDTTIYANQGEFGGELTFYTNDNLPSLLDTFEDMLP